MNSMFHDATSFNQNISGWNTGSVIDMREMFFNATSFDGDLKGWDCGKVRECSDMLEHSGVEIHSDKWPDPTGCLLFGTQAVAP